MTHLTLFNPSFRRLFADPFFDLPVRYTGSASGRGSGASLWTPPVDVRESDTEVVVEAELPGLPARTSPSATTTAGSSSRARGRKPRRPAKARTAPEAGSAASGRSGGSTAPSTCRRAWTPPPSGRSPGTASCGSSCQSSRRRSRARSTSASTDRARHPRGRQPPAPLGAPASGRHRGRRPRNRAVNRVERDPHMERRSAFGRGAGLKAATARTGRRSPYSVTRSWPGMTRRLLIISSS